MGLGAGTHVPAAPGGGIREQTARGAFAQAPQKVGEADILPFVCPLIKGRPLY